MKRVVIVRHAKAVPYGYEDDFNRDLTDRGKSDASLVSNILVDKQIMPDTIISSPAKRALKTARIFAGNLGFERNRITENDDIYDGLTTSEFLGLIHELPDEAKTVFFFGHNPGFHFFVNNLLKHTISEMPTCATVGIEFNVDKWDRIESRSGDLAFRVTPKMLK